MEKNIVKNGTKVILFSTEDTNVTGWSTMSVPELDGILIIFKEEISRLFLISLLTSHYNFEQWYRVPSSC